MNPIGIFSFLVKSEEDEICELKARVEELEFAMRIQSRLLESHRELINRQIKQLNHRDEVISSLLTTVHLLRGQK
jgi:hypothetical protein